MDSRKISIFKTVSWRLFAVVNSYIILVMVFSTEPIYNALIMNFTGMFTYYAHERVWDKIKDKL
jgi:hypothetical protein